MVVLYQLTSYLYQVLSPLQRYQSMRRLHKESVQNVSTSNWFVIAGLAVIGVLAIVLYVFRRLRLDKERLALESQFRESCDKHRLTGQERKILGSICRHAQLEGKNLIFTNHNAFETGFTRLIQESFSAGHSLKQRKQLNIMVQCIKAKLGFQKSAPTNDGAVMTSRKMGSRQIPQGRNVRVETMSESSVFCIEAKVIRNDSFELVLQPDMSIEATPGQTVFVQYKVGAMIWIFESTIIACGPGGLELNHSEDMKFLNRRRFPRVAVQKKAKVALFEMNQALTGELTAPNFEDAVVRELSGPGLQIQTNQDLKILSRVLVLFEAEPGRVVQDVAEVRGVRETQSGRQVAVEMIGLNENTVNDLIRITHLIAKTNGTLLSEPQLEGQSGLSGQYEMPGILREQEHAI
jgi:hypothetical protein